MIVKHVVTSGIFDREFIKGFHGGIPNINESRMLIIKRPAYERWAPGKYYFPTETHDPEKDLGMRGNNIGYVMVEVAKRGFLEECNPDEKCNPPHLDYVGWYKNIHHDTEHTIHVCLGNIWSPDSLKPRKELGKMLHATEEVPVYRWKTLPEVIEMNKEGKMAGEQAIYMIAQEIERRMKGVNTVQEGDILSRLMLNL